MLRIVKKVTMSQKIAHFIFLCQTSIIYLPNKLRIFKKCQYGGGNHGRTKAVDEHPDHGGPFVKDHFRVQLTDCLSTSILKLCLILCLLETIRKGSLLGHLFGFILAAKPLTEGKMWQLAVAFFHVIGISPTAVRPSSFQSTSKK